MKIVAKAVAVAAIALTAGCEVNVDNNVAAAAEEIGNDLEAAAEDAGNTIGEAGDAVGNQVSAVTNNVDVDVDVGGDTNEAANANKQ